MRQLIIKILKEQTGQNITKTIGRRPNKIFIKMIDELGLYDAVKMAGGYESLLSHINPEDISDKNKIKFIQEVINTKGPEISSRGYISIFDLGIYPVPYDSYRDTERTITTFYMYGVKINVYKGGRFITDQVALYDNIPEDVLDNIFNFMIGLLDDKKEEMTEGELTERCWKGYTQKGMKTMFGKKYPNCVKVKK